MMFTHWMYLRGLIVLENTGEPMILFHGTTRKGARSIMRRGLRKQSDMDPTTNMAGEFWGTTSHDYASLMSMVGENTPTADNPPVVLKFSLPATIFQILRKDVHYHTLDEGAFEFLSKSFPVLNRAITENGGFQVVPLTPNREATWKEMLAKQQGGAAQQPGGMATQPVSPVTQNVGFGEWARNSRVARR